jgi:hypothetical protein
MPEFTELIIFLCRNAGLLYIIKDEDIATLISFF